MMPRAALALVGLLACAPAWAQDPPIPVAVPRLLVGQGVPTNVTHFFRTIPVEGPHFGLVSTITGSEDPWPWEPSYKVAGYFEGISGWRGDDIVTLNSLAWWRPGDPRSNIVGLEVDVANNNRDVGAHDTPYVTGALIMSGSLYHPGRAVIIDSTTPEGAWRIGLDIMAATEIGLSVGKPTIQLTGAAVLKQIQHDTLVLQARGTGGSFFRGVSEANQEKSRLSTDGNLSLWGTGETLNLSGTSEYQNINFFNADRTQRLAAIQVTPSPGGAMLSIFLTPAGAPDVVRAITIDASGAIYDPSGLNLGAAIRLLQAELEALKRRIR